jgi:CelD/BcsL family acetyltransferase involved in cellulose biosynthesis
MIASSGRIFNNSAEKSECTVSTFDSFDAVDITRREWNDFVRETGGAVYLTYDWCRIWWHHYGQDRILRLYIFREGGHLVGLAPMFIECVRLGPAGLRIAKRVASDSTLEYFGLPLAPDHVEVIYRELLKSLIEFERCDAVWFGFVSGHDLTLSGLREVCHSLKETVTIVRDKPAGKYTVIDLPDTFKTYLATMDRRQRKSCLRRLRRLKELFKVESGFVKAPSEILQSFMEFKSLHEHQWRTQGKLGHFADWPRSAAFNLDLVKELSRLDQVRMFRLTADRKSLEFDYCFVFGGCCYMRLPARVIGPEWDRFGLGGLGLVLTIESAIAEHIRRIDLGTGQYPYKLQFGAKEFEYRSILIATKSTARRARLFLRLSDLLHLVYYRIWFLRLAPHIGLFRKPLWRTWIRSRL